MPKLILYIFRDILRNKIVIALSIFLFAVSFVLFNLEENSSKAMLSILNMALIITPLISMIFAAIHYYNSYEFIELMLAQPISRKKILSSEFFALGLALSVALLAGLGLPLIIYQSGIDGIWLLTTTIPLAWSCIAIAFAITVNIRDKAKGIGTVLLLWFYLSLIYDGLILFTMFSLSDYPLEKITLGLIALNPIDLARVSIMLKMDVSALMGYTGALYKHFFGSVYGFAFTFGILLLWIIVPLFIAHHSFQKKDI